MSNRSLGWLFAALMLASAAALSLGAHWPAGSVVLGSALVAVCAWFLILILSAPVALVLRGRNAARRRRAG
jgi:hypothetical protein